MIAWRFRVMQNGKPNGWTGFVFGDNIPHLFEQIEFYTDPYSVEVRQAFSGSAFMYQHKPDEWTYECENVDADIVPFDESGGSDDWEKPVWVTDPDFDI